MPAKVSAQRHVLALRGAAFMLVLACSIGWRPPEAGLTELVSIDHRTGLAIHGYDPVAYFISGVPMPGLPAYEYVWRDATWRFATPSNRAAFMAHPEVYAPAFGGYDPVRVAQASAVDGNPNVFLIAQGKLFLFSDNQSRTEFAARPAAMADAERGWPRVKNTLAP